MCVLRIFFKRIFAKELMAIRLDKKYFQAHHMPTYIRSLVTRSSELSFLFRSMLFSTPMANQRYKFVYKNRTIIFSLTIFPNIIRYYLLLTGKHILMMTIRLDF